MLIQIKHRYTGEVLHECEAESIREAVENAVRVGAVLTDAVLRDADLRDADLTGAYLTGADLRDADLTGAYLTGAVLRDADLTRLPVGDPRGYDAVAQQVDGEWIILAGCRRFSIAAAREHWGDSYQGDRETGDRYLYALDWLEKKISVEAALKAEG